MNATRVAYLVGAPIVVVGSGTSAWLYIPICAGGMHGLARFFGPDSNLDHPTSNSLESIWFTAGARTRRGVGVGSTRVSVVRAYGKHLHRDGNHGLYIVGQREPIALDSAGQPAAYGRPVVYFSFFRNKVIEIGYGVRQQVLQQAEPFGGSDGSAYC